MIIDIEKYWEEFVKMGFEKKENFDLNNESEFWMYYFFRKI